MKQKIESSRSTPTQFIYDNQNNLAMMVTPRGYQPPTQEHPWIRLDYMYGVTATIPETD